MIRRGDPIEVLGFTDLHIAVLQLGPPPVSGSRIALTTPKSINQQDFIGRTALSWATELGKTDQICQLLVKGADPNLADFSGVTPLQYCAHDTQCLALLLEAGANVNYADYFGYTKRWRLLGDYDDLSCLETLCILGAKPDLDCSRIKAINFAAQYGKPRAFRWLLDQPVDLEGCKDEWGGTPLLNFLHGDDGGGGHPYMLKMLLAKKPNILSTDLFGEGVLHYLARFNGISYMNIFKQMVDLSVLDVERRSTCGFKVTEESHPGKTALELAGWRRDSQLEWAANCVTVPDPDPHAWFTKFESFIASIRRAHDAKRRDINSGSSPVLTRQIATGVYTNEDHYILPRVPGAYPQE